jgi:WD40 repeat protein
MDRFRDRSVTELEMLHGVLRDTTAKRRAFFCLRDPAAIDSIPADDRSTYVESDPARRNQLAALKSRIRASGLAVLDGYDARWGNGRLTGLGAFGDRVHDQLLAMIGAELELPNLGDASLLPALDPLEEARDLQDRFIESRLRTYVGRDGVHADLLSYVAHRDGAPAIIEGNAGSGKSTALARLVADLRAHRPDVAVVAHFDVTSSRSRSLAAVFDAVCRDLVATVLGRVKGERLAVVRETDALGLKRSDIERTFAIPDEMEALAATLGRFLRLVPADTPTVVVMDLGNEADQAPLVRLWLPDPLPPHVRLLLTAGWRTLDIVKSRPHTVIRIPPLSLDERRALIELVPSLSAKRLDEKQTSLLLKKPSTATPEFLQVALEELRSFGSYEHLTDRIRALPGGEPPSLMSRALSTLHVKAEVETRDPTLELFEQMLDRLEHEFDASFVRHVLGLIYAGLGGLSESELRDLSADHPHKADLFPLLRQLRPYLLTRGDRIGFQSATMATAVGIRYLFQELADHDAFHRMLAEYYERQPYRLADGQPNVRKVEVLEDHWRAAKDEAKLLATLFDIRYVETKIDAGLAARLAREYDDVAQFWRPPNPGRLRTLALILRRSTAWLRQVPASGFQELWNAGASHPALAETLAAWHDDAARLHDRVWIRSLRSDPDAADSSIVRHGPTIAAVAVSQNGKLFATAGGDAVRIWTTDTSELRDQIYSPAPVLAVDLFGPPAWLDEARETDQGRLFVDALGVKDVIDRVAYAAGRTVHIARVGSGEELARFDHGPIDAPGLFRAADALRERAQLPAEEPWKRDELVTTGTNNGTPCVRFAPIGVQEKMSGLVHYHKGLLIASSWGSGVSVWHAQTGALVREFAKNVDVEDIRWAGGENVVAAGIRSGDGEPRSLVPTFLVVNAATGAVEWQEDYRERLIPPQQPGHLLMIYAGTHRSVAVYGADGDVLQDRPIPIELDVMATSATNGLIASYALHWERRAGVRPKTIQVWNTMTGERTASHDVRGRAVTALAFLPDERLLAAYDDGTAQVLDAERLRAPNEDHAGEIAVVVFSPDGQWIATGSNDATVRLWRPADGSFVKMFDEDFAVNSLAFSPASDRLAIQSGAQCLIRRIDDGAPVATITLPEEPGYGAAVDYAPDARHVAIAAHTSAGYRVSLADAETGAIVWQSEADESGNTNHQEPSIKYSRDGQLIATGGRWCKTIRVWNSATGALVRSYAIAGEMVVGVDAISWSGDDSHLATYCSVMTTTTARDAATLEAKEHYRLLMDVSTLWYGDGGFLMGSPQAEDHTVITRLNGIGGIVARFPKKFARIAAHPDHHTFAATAGSRLYVLKVEHA